MNAKRKTKARKRQEVLVHIRWMQRRDWPEVLDIDKDGFDWTWVEEDVICCLRKKNCIGMAAEHEEEMAGFMVYELHKHRIQLLRLAVTPDYRRRGVGTQMVAKLKGKLSTQHRMSILVEVRESNLPGQLFFCDLGFRAVKVFREFFIENDEDAYLFEYAHGKAER